MTRFRAIAVMTLALSLCAPVAFAQNLLDDKGGHTCSATDVTFGDCAPEGSYHCHVPNPPCEVPAGMTASTSGRSVGGQVTTSASPTSTAAASAAPTAAPTIGVATPVPTARALSTTGTITDVLGWSGLALLFFGLALVLFGPPARRRRARRAGV